MHTQHRVRNRGKILVLVVATTSLMVSACGSSGDPSTAGASKDQLDIGVGKITPNSSKTIVLMSNGLESIPYSASVVKGAQQAAKEAGYKLEVKYSKLDPATELANFQNVIANSSKYAGLLLNPVNSQLCVPIQSQALKANLPIIILSNALCDDGKGSGEALWAKGTLSYVGGQSNAPGIADALDQSAKILTGPQKVGLVLGPKGHPNGTVGWEYEWSKFSGEHPDWTLEDTVYTDFTPVTAFNLVQNMLTAHPDISVMYTSYVDLSGGAIKAIKARGLSGKISVFDTTGGNEAAVEMVKAGDLTGDMPSYPISLGQKAAETLVAALSGTQPAHYIGGDGNPDASKSGFVTKSNVDQFTAQW